MKKELIEHSVLQKRRQISKILKSAFKILGSEDKLKAVGVLFINLFLALADIFAVFIFGIIGSLSASGLGGFEKGNTVGRIVSFFGLEQRSLQTQVVILGLFASTTLIFKSLASLYLSRRTLLYLSNRSALFSRVLLDKLLRLEMSQINSKPLQEHIFTMTVGVQIVVVRILGGLLLLISDVVLIVLFSVSLFIVDAKTAFVSFAVFGFVSMVLYFNLYDNSSKFGELITQIEIESNKRIEEAINCYKELYVGNRRDYYSKRIGLLRSQSSFVSAKLNLIPLFSKYIMEISLVIGVLLVGIVQFTTQPVTRAVAATAIFLLASARILPAILRVQTGLLGISSNISAGTSTLDMVEELTQDEKFLKRKNEAEVKTQQAGEFLPTISIADLWFRYSKDKDHVIRGLDLEVSAGEVIGIVGRSGSGKTTLVDLIIGLLTPEVGKILISGVDPRKAIEIWPGSISYVPQNNFMFNGTLRDNVCLGYERGHFSDSEVEEALRKAQLLDFLRSSSTGLDTQISDRGSNLSGGQRQRIGIARALLTQPKIVILDEATSSLDSVTEKEIVELLETFRGDITLLIVTHRLSSIRNANQVIFISEDSQIKVGSFEDLKKTSKSFREQSLSLGI